jgi:hypothetical protein
MDTTTDQTLDRLTTYAEWWEAERKIRFDDESVIRRDKAVTIALMNLDTRYRTYADDSWTAEVIEYVTTNVDSKMGSPDWELWLQRESDVIVEVHQQMDILYTKRSNKWS